MVMFLTIGLGVLPLAATSGCQTDLGHLIHSAELWFLLGSLTLFSTLLPFVLMNRYQRHVSSSEAGVIYGAEPVLACLLALFLPEFLAPIIGISHAKRERLHTPRTGRHASYRLTLFASIRQIRVETN